MVLQIRTNALGVIWSLETKVRSFPLFQDTWFISTVRFLKLRRKKVSLFKYYIIFPPNVVLDEKLNTLKVGETLKYDHQ